MARSLLFLANTFGFEEQLQYACVILFFDGLISRFGMSLRITMNEQSSLDDPEYPNVRQAWLQSVRNLFKNTGISH